MPRKSGRNISLSQASTSSQNASQLSQSKIDKHFAVSQLSLDEQVKNCVRYIVINAGHTAYFRRADIQKHCVSKAGQHFQQVMEKVTNILKNVYGYNMLVCDQSATSSKAYIVSNALPYQNYNLDKNEPEPEPKEMKKILLLLILSHIFMANSSISEASLFSFLKEFKIDVNVRHPLFGHCKDYIMTTLVKQKFLSVETDPITKRVSLSWGIRAEKEISKHEILKFVCKMFKDSQPKAWSNQFTAANEQGFENDRFTEENGMELNEDD